MSQIETTRVPYARRKWIVEYLGRNGAASVGQLANALGVSLATVHRDLRALESEAAIQRVQGGAALLEDDRSGDALASVDSPWARRVRSHVTEKLAIGFAALRLIERGDTVFIDASTTGLALAAAIETTDLPLTIVTTSPAIAQTMTSPTVRVVVVPGQVDQELRIIAGSWSTEFLEHFTFSSAFVSCAGISEEGGLYTESRDIQVTLRTALQQSRQKVCLLDASKFERVASLLLCRAEEMDAFVLESPSPSPSPSPHDSEARIARRGVRLHYADNRVPVRLDDSAIYRAYFA